MSQNNHGWNDDEETIINFTSKPQTPPSDGVEPPAPNTNNPLGLAAPALPTTSTYTDPQLSPRSSSATPPAPNQFPAPPSAARGAGPWSGPASAHGQDPYLAAAGLQDSLPPEASGVQAPPLPPIPKFSQPPSTIQANIFAPTADAQPPISRPQDISPQSYTPEPPAAPAPAAPQSFAAPPVDDGLPGFAPVRQAPTIAAVPEPPAPSAPAPISDVQVLAVDQRWSSVPIPSLPTEPVRAIEEPAHIEPEPPPFETQPIAADHEDSHAMPEYSAQFAVTRSPQPAEPVHSEADSQPLPVTNADSESDDAGRPTQAVAARWSDDPIAPARTSVTGVQNFWMDPPTSIGAPRPTADTPSEPPAPAAFQQPAHDEAAPPSFFDPLPLETESRDAVAGDTSQGHDFDAAPAEPIREPSYRFATSDEQAFGSATQSASGVTEPTPVVDADEYSYRTPLPVDLPTAATAALETEDAALAALASASKSDAAPYADDAQAEPVVDSSADSGAGDFDFSTAAVESTERSTAATAPIAADAPEAEAEPAPLAAEFEPVAEDVSPVEDPAASVLEAVDAVAVEAAPEPQYSVPDFEPIGAVESPVPADALAVSEPPALVTEPTAAAAVSEPAPVGRIDIDPPTIMDVPIKARRARDGEAEPIDTAAAADPPVNDVAVPVVAVSAIEIGSTEAETPAPAPAEDAPAAESTPQAVTDGATVVDPVSADHEIGDALSQPESEMERTNLRIPVPKQEEVADLAWLAVIKTPGAHANQIYRLDSMRMEIGRAFDAPIYVDDKTVSSRHAAIRYERLNDCFEFILYDLASTNGSFVNGSLVHMTVLSDNDRIKVGETELVFKKVGDPPASDL